ncbi:MAG TPA: hypothetical protein VJ986_14480 [Gaiellaceae bacterium]|nr:hypothetical protein [Gaiellaceae bacterium]
MAAIDASRRSELARLVDDLRRAGRTIHAETLAARRETRDLLVAGVREGLEPHARLDEPGLEALDVWVEALQHADVNDVDLLQELLYGIDALVRVHVWRETGLPLAPPAAHSAGDV